MFQKLTKRDFYKFWKYAQFITREIQTILREYRCVISREDFEVYFEYLSSSRGLIILWDIEVADRKYTIECFLSESKNSGYIESFRVIDGFCEAESYRQEICSDTLFGFDKDHFLLVN